MDKKKPITLSLEEDLIRKIKLKAIEKDTTVSKIIEGWIRENGT